MIDKFGRSINYLRVSLTENCNLRCVYCMPEEVKFEKGYVNDHLSFEDYKFFIKAMSEIGITKVRFTGGEPLLYPRISELIRFTKEECNIHDIGISTNGIGLYEIVRSLKSSGLSSVNISLNSLKEYKYKTVTRGGQLKEVLKSINEAIRIGLKVKINCVAIDGFNDDELNDFMDMTRFSSIDVRFIELMPIGEAKKIYTRGYLNIREILDNMDGIHKIGREINSTSTYYKLEKSKGRIGIISPISCSFCNDCNRIRLTAKGRIKLCLHSEEEIDIRNYSQKPLIFRETMKEVILQKPQRHRLIENRSSESMSCMYQIGG